MASAYKRLVSKGLSHEQAIETLRERFASQTGFGALARLGFNEQQAMEFLREQAQATLEARVEFLRERNKRGPETYRKMVAARRANGNLPSRDPVTGRWL
jgi:hypothetical protein